MVGATPTVTSIIVTSILTANSSGVQIGRNSGSLSNGQNDNVAISSNASYMTFTGPTGAYSVTGFANPADGRILFVYFNVGQTLTLKHDTGSSVGNKLTIAGGADKTFAASAAVRCIFVYDQSVGAGAGYWVLFDASDGTTAGF